MKRLGHFFFYRYALLHRIRLYVSAFLHYPFELLAYKSRRSFSILTDWRYKLAKLFLLLDTNTHHSSSSDLKPRLVASLCTTIERCDSLPLTILSLLNQRLGFDLILVAIEENALSRLRSHSLFSRINKVRSICSHG